MDHFNSNVLVFVLMAAVIWFYSRWLIAAEHAKYQKRHTK